MHERAYSSPYLCDLTISRIGVECAKCGRKRSYDRLKLIARLTSFDHQCLPSLLKRLAKAEGCERAKPENFHDPCGLIYDEATRQRR